MAWYECIVDNSYDGVVGYRKGRNYDLTGTPPSAFFTAVTASAVRNDDNQDDAQTDLDNTMHVYQKQSFEGGQSTAFVDLDLNDSSTVAEGRLKWNSDDGTIEIGMPGGTVAQQIGHEQFVPRRVKNDSGADMTNGQLVYISGGSGNNAEVSLARADAEATAKATIAMLTEDIDDGDLGWATTFGLVRGVNTGGTTIGDDLYLDASTAGAYTTTRPEHPNYSVKIGKVFRVHASEGIILLDIEPPITACCVAGGESFAWDDIQISISNIRVPVANAPTERLYDAGITSGVTFPFLGFAVGDYLYFDVQTPHSMLLNSVLDQHIHYTTPTDGTGSKFKFQLDVIACPIGGAWAAPTGSPFTSERSMDSDDSGSQVYFELATVPAVNTTVSTLYKCRLERIAASADEYAGEVYVSFLDGHYKKDSLGSRNETSKG